MLAPPAGRVEQRVGLERDAALAADPAQRTGLVEGVKPESDSLGQEPTFVSAGVYPLLVFRNSRQSELFLVVGEF